LEAGGWKVTGRWGWGGIAENDSKREGALDVKFNTMKGGNSFHSFFQTGKVVEELLELKYKYLNWNKTHKFINSKVFWSMKCFPTCHAV